LLAEDVVKIDNFSGFHEDKKKNIILPISETLKYLENSHDNNMANEWNSKSLPIDIERQRNTTMLDVLNYHTFMYAINKSKNNDNTVSKNIKLFYLVLKNLLVLFINQGECLFLGWSKNRFI